MDGRVHHFSAGGLFNGLALLVDDETGSWWDHITGACVHGPLKGRQLETWPLTYTTVAGAEPELRVFRPSGGGLRGALLKTYARGYLKGKGGFLPPNFRRTMVSQVDPRLDEMENGLGVIEGGRARFYPMSLLAQGLREDWGGRRLELGIDPVGGGPFARWEDGGRPMQLFTRWYGFSFTYPGCEVAG